MQWMYVFLWMFVVKEKKMSKFITDNIDISSDDSDKKHSDEEIQTWKMFLSF